MQAGSVGVEFWTYYHVTCLILFLLCVLSLCLTPTWSQEGCTLRGPSSSEAWYPMEQTGVCLLVHIHWNHCSVSANRHFWVCVLQNEHQLHGEQISGCRLPHEPQGEGGDCGEEQHDWRRLGPGGQRAQHEPLHGGTVLRCRSLYLVPCGLLFYYYFDSPWVSCDLIFPFLLCFSDVDSLREPEVQGVCERAALVW